jgi:hypothetical protein
MATLHFSPLGAVAVDVTSRPSSVVSVVPGPASGVTLRASAPVRSTDSQWVLIALPVMDGLAVRGVGLGYQVRSVAAGSTYIAQTRLTSMTTPDATTVKHDDATQLASPQPVVRVSDVIPAFTVKAAITLELKLVFGSADDSISIGGLQLIV